MESQRLDQWLWHARFAKTRSLAARLASGGKVRVNGAKVRKPSHLLRRGDVLTLTLSQVRVVRVMAFGLRRGPAAESRFLFEEISGSSAT